DLLPETIVLCPDEIKFIRIPAPYDQGNILWSNGKTLPEIDVPRSPWIAVEVQLNDSCKTILRDTTLITLIDKVNIKILSADSVCIGDTIELKAICNGRCFDFSWNTGSTSPNLLITEPGRYSITAKTACEVLEASKDIAASGKMVGSFIQFPNVFAPNGEEKNRSFGPVLEPGESHRLVGLHLMVYNRWGQKLFETRDKNEQWHPDADVPMESYIYFCEVEYQDCNQIRKSVFKGTTSLIR
ncbi:MAG TPA: gliding motility-associated C-terminal domain-containing protein, partial [Saprospiraceae bacterium]|nr:gliding motility-associated C-terminal domain-containing protein [Saprospiraceae bacterium]